MLRQIIRKYVIRTLIRGRMGIEVTAIHRVIIIFACSIAHMILSQGYITGSIIVKYYNLILVLGNKQAVTCLFCNI